MDEGPQESSEQRYYQSHRNSFENAPLISASSICGCFYCCSIFPCNDIKIFLDKGQTAVCPICNADAVIGDAFDTVTPEYLGELYRFWFGSERWKDR